MILNHLRFSHARNWMLTGSSGVLKVEEMSILPEKEVQPLEKTFQSIAKFTLDFCGVNC